MIETVDDKMKNIFCIEHFRNQRKSIWNCFVNGFTGLVTYTYLFDNPFLNLETESKFSSSPVIFKKQEYQSFTVTILDNRQLFCISNLDFENNNRILKYRRTHVSIMSKLRKFIIAISRMFWRFILIKVQVLSLER